MIIYGSKMYGVNNVVYGYGACEHCGEFVKHKSYDGRKWGHLYFIPLFPLGGNVRVLKECPKCSMGAHVPHADFAEYYAAVERMLPMCVEAAGNGKHDFVDGQTGDALPTGAFLVEAVETLHVAGRGRDLAEIQQTLHDMGATYEARIMAGAIAEQAGDFGQAQQQTEAATQAAPDDVYAWARLADCCGITGDAPRQLACLQKAFDLSGRKDPSLLLSMLGPLEAMQRFREMVDAIDESIRLAPELEGDKEIRKLRKKCDKQATKLGM